MIDHAEMITPSFDDFFNSVRKFEIEASKLSLMSFEAPNFTKIQFPIDAQWSRIVVFHQKTFIFDNL